MTSAPMGRRRPASLQGPGSCCAETKKPRANLIARGTTPATVRGTTRATTNCIGRGVFAPRCSGQAVRPTAGPAARAVAPPGCTTEEAASRSRCQLRLLRASDREQAWWGDSRAVSPLVASTNETSGETTTRGQQASGVGAPGCWWPSARCSRPGGHEFLLPGSASRAGIGEAERRGITYPRDHRLRPAGGNRLDFRRKQSVHGNHDGPGPGVPAARPARLHRSSLRLPPRRRQVPLRPADRRSDPRPLRALPTGGRGVAAIAQDRRGVMSRTSSSVARTAWSAATPPPAAAPKRLGRVPVVTGGPSALRSAERGQAPRGQTPSQPGYSLKSH